MDLFPHTLKNVIAYIALNLVTYFAILAWVPELLSVKVLLIFLVLVNYPAAAVIANYLSLWLEPRLSNADVAEFLDHFYLTPGVDPKVWPDSATLKGNRLAFRPSFYRSLKISKSNSLHQRFLRLIDLCSAGNVDEFDADRVVRYASEIHLLQQELRGLDNFRQTLADNPPAK